MLEVDEAVVACLRQWAPECLREPFLRAIGERGYVDRRVSAAIDFTEACTRYLTALLAPEGALGAPVSAFEDLKAALQRPSVGHWLRAADGLATRLCKQPHALAHAAALVLRTSKGKPTEAWHALERLVRVRNELAHEGRLDTTSDRAIHRYEREMAPDLRVVFGALACVEVLPIYAFDELDREAGRSLRLHCFAGPDPSVAACEAPAGMRSLEPLLISPDGRTLELGPFLAVRIGTDLRPRLLDQYTAEGAQFLDAKGEKALEAPDAWCRRWRSDSPAGSQATAPNAELARALHSPSRTTRPPPRRAAPPAPRRSRLLPTLVGVGIVAALAVLTGTIWPERPAATVSEGSQGAAHNTPQAGAQAPCSCQGVAPRQVFVQCTQPAEAIDLAAVNQAGVAAVRTAYTDRARNPAKARRLAEEAVEAFDCEIKRRRFDLAGRGVPCPDVPAKAGPVDPRCRELARPIGDRAWAYNLAGDLGRAENGQRDLLALQTSPELRAASFQQLAELRCRQARPAEAIEFIDEALRLKPQGKGVDLRQQMRKDIQATCRW